MEQEIIITETRLPDEIGSGFIMKLLAKRGEEQYMSNMLRYNSEEEWQIVKAKVYEFFEKDIREGNILDPLEMD
jgi:hypothetical protein